ncbi:unnamed protein product, partial [Allacma fusca]
DTKLTCGYKNQCYYKPAEFDDEGPVRQLCCTENDRCG